MWDRNLPDLGPDSQPRQSAPSLLALQPQDAKTPTQQAKVSAGTGNLSWLLCKCSKSCHHVPARTTWSPVPPASYNRGRAAGFPHHEYMREPARVFMARACGCHRWGSSASINSGGTLLSLEVSPKKQIRFMDKKASEGAPHSFGYITPKQLCPI